MSEPTALALIGSALEQIQAGNLPVAAARLAAASAQLGTDAPTPGPDGVPHVEGVYSTTGATFEARCSCGWTAGPFDSAAEARAHAEAHVGVYASLDEARAAHDEIERRIADDAAARAAEREAADEETSRVEADALARVADVEARVSRLETSDEQALREAEAAPEAP